MERLNLEGNNISDVSPIAGLTNLKWLKLTNNPISDFSPLAELSQITNIIAGSVNIPDRNLRAAIAETLGKGDVNIVSITAEEMMSLTHLDARNYDEPRKDNISNLTGLESAVNLSFLHIGGNSVSNLSPLSGLLNLNFLDAERNSISDISSLKGLINLKGLILTDNMISDLSPLERLTNLEALRINRNLVTDFSPILHLTTLKEVWIANSTFSDLSQFEGLINLEGIHAWDVPIEDLSPLTRLTKLRWLDFGRTQVSDLAPLASLANLRKLTFYDCQIDNLSHLEGLTELVQIKMPHNMISDLSSLKDTINLSYLELGDNDISDISPLDNLTNLKTLWIGNNNITDVSPLSKLTNLKELNIRNNPITDFSPLAGLFENTKILFVVVIPDVNLRSAIVEALGKEDADSVPITLEEMATITFLPAQNKEISDLTGLEHAVNLVDLNVPDNQITDLSPVSKLINLKVLNIYNNPIESLSPVSGLSNLEVITLVQDGGISDISPLAGLVKLRHFLSWGNPISDLSPLAGLTALGSLDICGANLSESDLSPLAKLTGLKRLYLASNGISDVSPLSKLKSLTHLNLEWNKISDVSPLAALTQLKWLGLHHNSISDFSPLAELSESTVFSRAFNPGAPTGGAKIEGPWLWITVPGEHLDSTTDLLAETSGGLVTEKQIATIGAIEGKPIGNSKWTASKISSTGGNNIVEMLNSLGVETDSSKNDRIIYGSIILNSLHEQNTNMLFGSNTETKIWLNGELVHQKLIWNEVRAANYHDFFPVTLKEGANVLLVAVDHHPWTSWNGFFGFEEGTEYTIIPPDEVSRLTFSATEITNLLAGDAFTLNLNAENITDLAGWQGDITFDSNALEAVEVTEGDFLKSEVGNTFFQSGTIDNTAGKITDLFSARVAESGVSGTGTLLSVTFKAKAGGETQVTLENFEFSSITGDIIPAVPPNITITVGEYPPWDVNQDGRVSIQDIVLVASDLGAGVPANLRTDVNRDGVVDNQDLILVQEHFGESTDSAASPMLAIDNKELTPTMVQTLIDQAQAADDGSLVFRQGIENLERLLASLIPEKTVLLANYPNPFNPETWIPYHLAKPGNVTLMIYAANGAVVWTLALGHQNAGVYQNRSRAAYWDGRNAVGEAVASGVYFYTLTAGEFSATRRMLILK